MKIINTNNTYMVYDDCLKVYDDLPAQVYTIKFNQMTGFFMEKHAAIDLKEPKIYGNRTVKVHKVLNSFERMSKNLGVILSGHKGIGKSLFAKQLSIEAIKKNIPVIIVDRYIKGIASYIESIEQEVMILFDEFEKTFEKVDDCNPQVEMLSLFDGIAQGKKLFVITCNEIYQLNSFLINRPGRFHYHFRFDFPTDEEIREYLTDKLNEKYYGEIESVVSFSKKVDLNYDCLRAIVFELNSGERFKDAIRDLNIINMGSDAYNAKLYFNNGKVLSGKFSANLFDKEEEVEIDFMFDNRCCYDYVVGISFMTSDCVYNPQFNMTIVRPEDMKIIYYTDEKKDDYAEEAKKLEKVGVKYLAITRCESKDIHYAV